MAHIKINLVKDFIVDEASGLTYLWFWGFYRNPWGKYIPTKWRLYLGRDEAPYWSFNPYFTRWIKKPD